MGRHHPGAHSSKDEGAIGAWPTSTSTATSTSSTTSASTRSSSTTPGSRLASCYVGHCIGGCISSCIGACRIVPANWPQIELQVELQPWPKQASRRCSSSIVCRCIGPCSSCTAASNRRSPRCIATTPCLFSTSPGESHSLRERPHVWHWAPWRSCASFSCPCCATTHNPVGELSPKQAPAGASGEEGRWSPVVEGWPVHIKWCITGPCVNQDEVLEGWVGITDGLIALAGQADGPCEILMCDISMCEVWCEV